MSKLYPFSCARHAHDVEFRRNRVKNIMSDMESGELPMDGERYDKLYSLHEELTELLLSVMSSRDGRLCYLTGKEIGLAKETVLWAGAERSERMKAH